MAWVEVETDEESWVLVASGLGLATGVAVWWLRDFFTGACAYPIAGFAVLMARQAWVQLRLPGDAHLAAERVLAWFRERFPSERVEGVAVRAVEPGRFVIAVRHGFGMPIPRRYFSVPRAGPGKITELPVEDWWPRGLK